MSELKTIARPIFADSRLFFYDEGYRKYLEQIRKSVIENPTDPKEQGRLDMFNELVIDYKFCHSPQNVDAISEEDGFNQFEFKTLLERQKDNLSNKFDIYSLGQKAMLNDFEKGFDLYSFFFSPINDLLFDQDKETGEQIGQQKIPLDLDAEIKRQEAAHKK